MAGNLLKTNWHILMNDLKERWPDLTEKDYLYIDGDQEKLVEVVQKRRHISTEDARQDVKYFLEHLNTRQRIV